MRYILAIFFSFLLVLSGVQSAFAYEVKVQPDISISENYISDQNLYLASLRTWFNSTYDKDLVSASYNQVVNGTIFGDVTLLGKNISLSGESFGDVRIIGDTITVSGVVNKDLILIARRVVITPEAIINGDTLILAQNVDALGQFLGKSQITASKINIAGSIVGPTVLTGSKVSFLSGAKVISELSYFSPQRAAIEAGVEIQKQPNYNQIETLKQNDVVKRLFFAFVSFWAIIKLIATLFVLFILTQLFRVFTQRIIDIVRFKKFLLIPIGLLSVICLPALVAILFVSLVLIPVSIIVGAVFTIMIILLPALSAIITAAFYQEHIQKQPKVTVDFGKSALALVLLTFAGFIPYVGSILVYIIYAVAFGATTYYLYEQVRRKKINIG
jgi:cytoskeletal protein CcmA (bactofilin family)